MRQKGHFTKDYKSGQQNYAVKGINISRDNNYIKAIREYSIKYFAFYYNSAYKVYKDAKYSIKWWPQGLKLNYTKAI